MKIGDLRNNHLLEIVTYLTPKDLITFEIVCKNFQEFLNKYEDIIQKSCILNMGLEYAPDLFHWKRIQHEKSRKTDDDYTLLFESFTTMNDTFGLNNLTQSSNIAEKNILSQYVFVEKLEYDIVSEGYNKTFYNPLDYVKENAAEKFQKFCPLIRSISLSGLNPTGNPNSLETYVFFSSLKFESLDLIQHFHSCENRESVLKAANRVKILEVTPISQEAEHGENNKNAEVIQFSRTSNSVQVLCWATMCENSQHFGIHLYEGVFARYFYALRISGDLQLSSSRMINFHIIPDGSLVQIRENGIE